MSLTDFGFILFLTLNVLVLLVIEKLNLSNKQRVKLLTILVFSVFYIAYNDLLSTIILFVVSFIVYFGSIVINGSNKENKKTWFSFVIGALVLTLTLFKYTNSYKYLNNVFFEKSINGGVLLPIGISFYIFTSISYVVDVYNNKTKTQNNYFDLLLLMFYYPKIISGPIVKAEEFFDQINKYDGINKVNFQMGIQLYWIGFFKKVVIANRLSLFTDQVFFSPSIFDAKTIILGILSYAMQIYTDFSGYSDMALGISKILGINLKKNFNFPYLAVGCSEFWKRWHISLSNWLKEYIYIPLGGNRKTKIRTYLNLIITMVISGIWHGNTINFILWGFLYGVWSCFDKSLLKIFNKNKFLKFIYWLITIILTNFLWVIFRSSSIDKALEILRLIFCGNKGINFPYVYSFIFLVIIVVIYIYFFKNDKYLYEEEYCFYLNLEKFSHLTLFFVFIELTILFGYFGDSTFVYGGF